MVRRGWYRSVAWDAALYGGVFVVLALLWVRSGMVERLVENVSYRLDSTAIRAYTYGERHFDAQHPQAYDVHAAAYFFQQALRLDPSLLYIHHEIARIYFLRGDFYDAITQIDIQIAEHGSSTPNSYYIRGLIEGYMGDYADSAKDYETFLASDPHNWAGINDYAWVLLKAERFADAERATAEGLRYFPTNAWLLNANAIALYEEGRVRGAQAPAHAAVDAATKLTQADWLHAYPGNDPKIAAQGLASFRAAAENNMHRIDAALASSTVQSR